MTSSSSSEAIAALNQQSLITLVRALQYSRGEFSLILVRCNYTHLRSRIVQQLRDQCPFPITTITLPEQAKTLLTSIRMALKGEGAAKGITLSTLCHRPEIEDELSERPPEALMVFGLESVQAIDALLTSTNQVREEFRKRFSFPVALWVNDHVLIKLIQKAPDFKNWASVSVRFELAPADLLRFLKNHTDRLFASILDAGDEQTPANWTTQTPNLLRVPELEFAIKDIQSGTTVLTPELIANIDFLQGQLAHSQGQLPRAHEAYENSLRYWLQVAETEMTARESPPPLETAQEIANQRKNGVHFPLPANAQPLFSSALLLHPTPLDRAACVCFYLGMAWRANAVLERAHRLFSYQQAEAYFRQSLELFEQEHRQDLVARFVIARLEVMQKLAHAVKIPQVDWWQAIENLATNALKLHHLYSDPIRQARDHGFLAEVMLVRGEHRYARYHADAALRILYRVESEADEYDVLHPNLENSLELANTYHRSWYLLLLAKAEQGLGHLETAIAHLETASHQATPQADPTLYIRILDTLRRFYYDQKRYREAFQIKQYQRTVERQFGYRAFVGALRLQPPAIAGLPLVFDAQALLAQEIAASGRQQDVERLISRLGRDDLKLTVLHGHSGVGKSSIITAGLIPALQDRLIGEQVALAIHCDRYRDWQTRLRRQLQSEAKALSLPLEPESDPSLPDSSSAQSNLTSWQPLITTLQDFVNQNYLPILIFDQFEEFFFEQENAACRRPFYEFLRACLNLDRVKVILALREDYLHYLLEIQRLPRTNAIELDAIADILGKNVRYPLGDFSPEDAKAVITSLTNQSQFYLEPDLIDELVHDLARETGEVRPIELQVVGAELQAENIDTLEEYRQKGPKEKLVQRSLETVIDDCGDENELVARTVLYSLTNDRNTRPLKTRDDLETDLVDLGLTHEIDKLDLVLEILVGSGLVFLVPENPDNCYQLVHDYLVSFIRQHCQPEHIENLSQGGHSLHLPPPLKNADWLIKPSTFLPAVLQADPLDDIYRFRLAEPIQQRLEELLEKQKANTLTSEEAAEWRGIAELLRIFTWVNAQLAASISGDDALFAQAEDTTETDKTEP